MTGFIIMHVTYKHFKYPITTFTTTTNITATTVLVVAVAAAVIVPLVAHPALVLRPTCVPKKVNKNNIFARNNRISRG
jgi:hypothetical protein